MNIFIIINVYFLFWEEEEEISLNRWSYAGASVTAAYKLGICSEA